MELWGGRPTEAVGRADLLKACAFSLQQPRLELSLEKNLSLRRRFLGTALKLTEAEGTVSKHVSLRPSGTHR